MNKFSQCKGQIIEFDLYYITLEINYIIHTLYSDTFIHVNFKIYISFLYFSIVSLAIR